MTNRSYVFCDYCSYKSVFEDNESDFVEIKSVPVPGGYPEINPENNKTESKKSIPQPKKVKCPKCGRGVRVKKLPEAYSKAFKQIDDENRKMMEEKDRAQRIKDGQPIKREDKFLG